MYFRSNDYTVTGLIALEIYRAVANATNNKPEEIKVELLAFNNSEKKIEYCEKETIKLIKILNENVDETERLQAIAFIGENKGYKVDFHKLIDKYCKGFTNNLPTSFYNSIKEKEAESLVKSNSHPNANAIIEDITKINKLSQLENSYIIDSIENFKKYMVIAIETQNYKLFVVGLKIIPKEPNIKTPITEYVTFNSMLSNDKKRQYVIDILEDLSITNNGKSILSSRKKGAIKGVVEALLEANILPQLALSKLCFILASEIGLELKSKLDESKTSRSFKTSAELYIKNKPLH